jgi:N-acetylglutamate synthase-like GNAT family acetyltransferase
MRPEPRSIRAVTTRERPDLAPVVAAWLWESFARAGGRSFEETLEAVQGSITATEMPRTFVLLIDGKPVGTASLAPQDLEERPELTPWLAGVFVEPESRGQGLVAVLIKAVERECRDQAIKTLWLYTRTAEKVYARAGWRTVETVAHNGKSYALMRRDLD